MTGRIRIEALHHDDGRDTIMVDPCVPSDMLPERLAIYLQELGRQHPDARVISVEFAPRTLIQISRLIRPLGGGWPRPVPDVSKTTSGFVAGLAVGLMVAAAILGLWWGAS